MGDTQENNAKKENEKNGIPVVDSSAPVTIGKPPSKGADQPASLRFFNLLFSRQTRFGRFNRIALRWLAIIIILFALSLLAGYQFLYKPAQDSSARLQNEVDQSKNQVKTLTDQVTALSTQVQSLSQQNARLAPANDRVQILELADQLQAARLFLEKKDFDSAQKILLANRTTMKEAAALLGKEDSSMPQTLQTLLDQALNKLASDPPAAASNLDAMIKLMQTLEKSLAPAN